MSYSFCQFGIAGFKAAAIGVGFVAALPANAGQLPASAFQIYNPSQAGSIQAGPFALLHGAGGSAAADPDERRLHRGRQEDRRLRHPRAVAAVNAICLTDIEPVVIGPGGLLYLTDGHHTFTALQDSSYGSSDPTVLST